MEHKLRYVDTVADTVADNWQPVVPLYRMPCSFVVEIWRDLTLTTTVMLLCRRNTNLPNLLCKRHIAGQCVVFCNS